MSGRPGNKRPSLTRAETIESCNSDDLVTVLEVHDRRPYKIMDRSREVKKGVMAESLDELIERGKEKLNYPADKEVYVVLEEDGTEVDEEEYFQTLPENTLLMLLHVGDKWSPFGPPYTPTKTSSDQTDHSCQDGSEQQKISRLLQRIKTDVGSMALLSGKELELLVEMDVDLWLQAAPSNIREDHKGHALKQFLEEIQTAANQHLLEKNEIRDAVELLKLYHRASATTPAP